MSYKITDDCISCGACEAECPNSAISEGDDQYQINADQCTECVGFFNAAQCADVCPSEACVADPDHKETEEGLIEKLKKINPSVDVSGDVPSHFKA